MYVRGFIKTQFIATSRYHNQYNCSEYDSLIMIMNLYYCLYPAAVGVFSL